MKRRSAGFGVVPPHTSEDSANLRLQGGGVLLSSQRFTVESKSLVFLRKLVLDLASKPERHERFEWTGEVLDEASDLPDSTLWRRKRHERAMFQSDWCPCKEH